MIKKIVLLSILIATLFFAVPILAADYGLQETAGNMGYSTDSKKTEITAVALTWVNMALAAAAIIFFAYALYAGLRWLTARGKEELITRGKEALENAILGLVIIFLAYAITNFVLGAIGVGGGSSAATGSCDFYDEPMGVNRCYNNVTESGCDSLCDPSIGAQGCVFSQDKECKS